MSNNFMIQKGHRNHWAKRVPQLAAAALSVALTAASARAETQNIPLSSGWNLVTFQVTPANPAPSAVFGSLPGFRSAWLYDTATKTWKRYLATTEPRAAAENALPPLQLTNVAVGQAYWIYADSPPATWTVSGTLPAIVPGVNTKAGWNLIGIPAGTTAPLTEKVNLLSVLSRAGFDYDTILRWEAGTQSFQHYSTANNRNTTSQELIPFDPNKAFWANVLTPSLLQPSLIATVRTDIDVEPAGNFPGLEDLNISGVLGPVATPKPVASQDRIVFFAGEDVQTLSLSNLGGGIMLWDVKWSPTDSPALTIPWLTVSTSSTETVATNPAGAPIRDYKILNGVTTVENDVIYLRLDRKNLGAGTYHGELMLTTTAGIPKPYHVEAVVPGLQGEWKGYATIDTVSGKKNPVPDIDLFVSFYEDAKTPGLMRGAIDSTNALLWPVDVPLIGYRQNNQGNTFQLTGAFALPPGDQNNEPFDVFDATATGNDANWNNDTKIDSVNPFPFPIHRQVTLSGTLLQGSPMTGYTVTGKYSEVVTGMSPQPIRLEGSFSMDRVASRPFSSRLSGAPDTRLGASLPANQADRAVKPVKASSDTGIEPVVIKKDELPHTIAAGANNFAAPFKVSVTTDQELRNLSLALNWSTLTHTNLIVTLRSPAPARDLLIHNGASLTPDGFKSLIFPDNRPTAGSLSTFLAALTTTKGDWELRIQNNGSTPVTLSSWCLRLEGQAVTSVAGRVLNGTTGVANVPVSLTGFPYSQTATTDSSGNFTMTRVPLIPLNFTVNSPAFTAADPATPGLSSAFTVPVFPNMNSTEAGYAAGFLTMPGAPPAVTGVGGYDDGSSASPFVLNVNPVVTTGPAAIVGGPLIGFAPLSVNLAAVNPGASVSWNFGDGTTSTATSPPEKTYTSPKVYTVTLDSPVGGAVEDTEKVIAMPSPNHAPASPAAVVAGASTTPYTAWCFQPFFTSGGALPAGVTLPTTAGSNTSASGAKYAELFMLQHTYAANFDLDLAPKTTVGSNFSADSFGTFAPSTFVSHSSNDAFSDPLNYGYQQEDHNYTLWTGAWVSSQVLGLDQGQNRGYTTEDAILHPPNRLGAVDDGVTYAQYRLTCNIGATITPSAGLGAQSVQTSAVHANPGTRPPLVEGTSGLAKNLYNILLTGPLAQDWVHQSDNP